MPDSPSAASTAAAAAMASGKHCPPPESRTIRGIFWFFTESLGEQTKASAKHQKAARGRSMKARPTQSRKGVKGGTSSLFVCPLWGLGQRPNCFAGDQHLKRTQQRRRQRSVPASNFARPQTRLQAALPHQDSVKKRFFARKLQIPRKIAKSIRIFSETLLTNCLSFGILIKLNRFSRANMAQSVEQRFRKPQVEGSSPSVGSLFEV